MVGEPKETIADKNAASKETVAAKHAAAKETVSTEQAAAKESVSAEHAAAKESVSPEQAAAKVQAVAQDTVQLRHKSPDRPITTTGTSSRQQLRTTGRQKKRTRTEQTLPWECDVSREVFREASSLHNVNEHQRSIRGQENPCKKLRVMDALDRSRKSSSSACCVCRR